MKYQITILVALLSVSGIVQAASLSRTDQNVNYIYQKGNYFSIGTGFVNPSLKGKSTSGVDTGNIAENLNPWAGSLKLEPVEGAIFTVGYDQPFGIDVKYKSPASDSPTGGMEAHILVHSYTFLAGYRLPSNVTFFGGPAYYRMSGSATLPAIGYRVGAPSGGAWGAVMGAAYEIPDIALRAALTYRTSAKYNSDSLTEELQGVGKFTSPVAIQIPPSLNFDFQTGIAPKTLLTTGVRWVNWKKFKISPPKYKEFLGTDLVSYQKNSYEYRLGIGRQLTDKLSGLVELSYDTGNGEPVSPLSAKDDSYGLKVGGRYDINETIDLSLGMQYIWYKDHDTVTNVAGQPTKVGEFKNMNVLGVGAQLGVHF